MLNLIKKPSIYYTYVLDGMKLQTLKLCLVRITFYIIQQPYEIMHNLCPNSRNYLGRSLSLILKCLQTSSLPNIPICNTVPIAMFEVYQFVFVDSKGSIFFHQTISHHNSICNLLLFKVEILLFEWDCYISKQVKDETLLQCLQSYLEW